MDIVDGGAFVTVKHIPAADGGVPQCQGLSVPHDVVVVGGRAVFRHGAVLVRQGIGGGILVAGQPHAAHVDVGLGVIVTAGVVRAAGVGVRGLRHLAVEVLGVGDEVGDIGLRGKRRASDCHNAGRVLARCHRDLPVAGWDDNDIACVVEYGLCASLRRDSAAGDGEVDVCIDAIAVAYGIATGGIHSAALDNKVVSEDSVTLRYHIAAGSGQAAAARDGEVNTILTVAIGVDTETGVVVAVGTGDGIFSCQNKADVAAAAVVDGGAP